MKQGFSMFLMVGAGCAVSARLGVMIKTARKSREGEGRADLTGRYREFQSIGCWVALYAIYAAVIVKVVLNFKTFCF